MTPPGRPPVRASAANDAATPATIALHRLPTQLRMLARVMGEAAAYKLVQWRGGTPFTVPAKARGRQFAVLVEVVGLDAAMALVAELPGHTLQLPKYDSVTRQLRHQRVTELRLRGVKVADVAMATGYTVRQVINICNDAGLAAEIAELAGQRDLFTAGPDPHNASGGG